MFVYCYQLLSFQSVAVHFFQLPKKFPVFVVHFFILIKAIIRLIIVPAARLVPCLRFDSLIRFLAGSLTGFFVSVNISRRA